jgi:nucleoside-diphosphate-sugar epimerase
VAFHVIVGAGATGSFTARLLADSGERVRLISLRGTGPRHPGIELVAADAADAPRLTELTSGASTLFACVMPPYDRWPELFPLLAAGLLSAAEATGADYVMLGNTYCYGPVDGVMTEDTPIAPTSVKGRLRARIWEDARAAHEAGRVRVTEVRAADFVGAGAVSPFTITVAGPVLAGAPVSYLGDLDAPHSWAYIGDAARTLVAAAKHADSWGRAWHVPSTSTASPRQFALRLASAAGLPEPQLEHLPFDELQKIAQTNSLMAEFPEILYLFDRPNLVDATLTEKTLGVQAAPFDEVVADMVVHGVG